MENPEAATQRQTPSKVNRRAILAGSAAFAAGLAVATPADAMAATPRAGASGSRSNSVASQQEGPVFISTPDQSIATNNGPVRGMVINDIYTYKGIPYGAPPTGALRFMPPVKPTPWTTPFYAIDYGPLSYQGPLTTTKPPIVAFVFNWDYGHDANEDCLRLNVWTPRPDGKKRPVIFWMHGGGYSTGSAQELPGYNGENVARRGDVVFVSINHRLNVFGYTNLASMGGSSYAASGNAGMLDIVLALQWVRDNIANFGGDPNNVTIAGQSGGGSKVITLQTMPSATGLFGRGISESGGSALYTPAQSSANAAKLLSTLGISSSNVSQLQSVGIEDLWNAWSESGSHAGPTVDGTIIMQNPLNPDPPIYGANVPMIIGATLDELSPSVLGTQPEDLTMAQLQVALTRSYGSSASSVLSAAQAEWGNVKPIELLGYIEAIGWLGGAAMEWAATKATQPAPVYRYLFSWAGPTLDGMPRAFHTSEIGFVFDNIDRIANYTGGTRQARALSDTMTDAWVAFARNGNPNHPGMTYWPQLTPSKQLTMVFDNELSVKNNPGAPVLAAITAATGTTPAVANGGTPVPAPTAS